MPRTRAARPPSSICGRVRLSPKHRGTVTARWRCRCSGLCGSPNDLDAIGHYGGCEMRTEASGQNQQVRPTPMARYIKYVNLFLRFFSQPHTAMSALVRHAAVPRPARCLDTPHPLKRYAANFLVGWEAAATLACWV